MKIDLNSIHLVSPKQNAEIVKMISDGTISGKQAKKLLTTVIEMNMKQIEEFLTKNLESDIIYWRTGWDSNPRCCIAD